MFFDVDGEYVIMVVFLCLVEFELVYGEVFEEVLWLFVLNDLWVVGVDVNLIIRFSCFFDGKYGFVDVVLGFGRFSGFYGFGGRFCFGSGLWLWVWGRVEGKEVVGYSRDLELDVRFVFVRILDFEFVYLVFYVLVVLIDSY